MGCGVSSKKKYDPNKEDTATTPTTTEEPANTGSATSTAPAEEPAKAAEPPPAAAEEEEESDDDGDGKFEDMDDEQFHAMMAAKRASKNSGVRQAVCAESIQVDANWEAPVHEKTVEQEARLKSALTRSFIFAALESDALAKVIKAFAEFAAEPGTDVITQGAEVTTEEPALFVLEEGELDVYKRGIEGPVHTYKTNGDYFGDLALLYNTKRAATVTAKTACKLWYIDRNTFNYLVKDAARQAKERRVDFLKEVPLLSSLNEDGVARLADALQVREVEEGVDVIKEGDVGTDFYIVELGTLVAKKGDDVVMNYDSKGFFGELALIRSDKRAATVTTTSAAKLLCLERVAFERLLGGLTEAMQKYAAEKYG